MELVEQAYRSTDRKHKKYVKRLTDFISTLLTKDRILEARYYFEELSLISPDHIKTITLGYQIAIRTFDREGVYEFDKQLSKEKRSEEDLCRLRLQYYYSVNNKENAEELAAHLLSKRRIKPESLRAISEFLTDYESYNVISSLSKYLSHNRMTFNPSMESRLKKIAIKKLVIQLRKVIH